MVIPLKYDKFKGKINGILNNINDEYNIKKFIKIK